MHVATVKIVGRSPLSQGKYYRVDKLPKESPSKYEERTWRERMHYNSKGIVFVPQTAIKNCLVDCAQYLGMQIPGKGKSTYTKHFLAGIMVENDLVLDTHKDDVKPEWVFVPADGKRGGSRRVEKCFPVIDKWGGEVKIRVLDDTIERDVLQKHLSEAGLFIGIGRFRPRNNGYYGRFEAKITEWKEV